MIGKINVKKIVVDHYETLKNHRTQKSDFSDYVIFIIAPTLIGFVLLWKGAPIDDKLSNILITSFSVFTGLLFNLLILVYDLASRDQDKKSDTSAGESKHRRRLIEEIYKNISFGVLLSIIIIIALLFSSFDLKISGVQLCAEICRDISSFFVYYCVALFILTILMILKRIHALLSSDITV